jgi:primosomal protein N' (replication factor Y)
MDRMSQGLSRFAEVAVPVGVHGTFLYTIPEELRDEIRRGSRVEVPWGSKLTTAFVTSLTDEPRTTASKLKPIRTLLDDEEPALIPEIIELCEWAASYYLAPIGEMLRMALPPNMAARGRRIVRATGGNEEVERALRSGQIVPSDTELMQILAAGDMEVEKLIGSRRGGRSALGRLADAGLLTVTDQVRDAAGVRFDRFVVLSGEADSLTPRQSEVVEMLRKTGGELPIRAVVNAGGSEAVVAALARKEVVRIERRARQHTLDPFLMNLEAASVGELRHSDEQQAALSAIRSRLGTFAPFLLQGVTGSGKTEIYIEVMRDVVKRGDQAILLVPEIALTPVFAARLKERFGERIAILHSNLSASEKYDQWWKARRGLVDVAIGPRSALFTPFQRLGLIVVDEEGDSAYKQEETPRYHARDLAVVRAQMRSIPVILGSATPSLESRENAARGKYTLLRLERRVEARSLPQAEAIDIRHEKGEKEDRGLIIFSARLREELGRVFEAGEQVIILINRRGYAPFLLCRECENDFRCRDCSVTMTVHRREGLLICHYCGLRRPIPSKCPMCGGEVLQPIGFGTEKVEERFRKYFPEVAVDVLDRDTARKRGELVRILERFRRSETRALIGTQIISKGHHFPNVTLTAVLNADSILGFPDFRSGEKTFYLLTQVAGRSGRGELPGRVLIQTAFPNHYAIRHALRHDYESFYAAEIEFRNRFHYPPATTMIALLLRDERLTVLEKAAGELHQVLEKEVAGIEDIRVQGPAPAPLARIKGVYRYQLLLRSAHRAALRKAVERSVVGKNYRGVDVVVDVDPLNIL